MGDSIDWSNTDDESKGNASGNSDNESSDSEVDDSSVPSSPTRKDSLDSPPKESNFRDNRLSNPFQKPNNEQSNSPPPNSSQPRTNPLLNPYQKPNSPQSPSSHFNQQDNQSFTPETPRQGYDQSQQSTFSESNPQSTQQFNPPQLTYSQLTPQSNSQVNPQQLNYSELNSPQNSQINPQRLSYSESNPQPNQQFNSQMNYSQLNQSAQQFNTQQPNHWNNQQFSPQQFNSQMNYSQLDPQSSQQFNAQQSNIQQFNSPMSQSNSQSKRDSLASLRPQNDFRNSVGGYYQGQQSPAFFPQQHLQSPGHSFAMQGMTSPVATPRESIAKEDPKVKELKKKVKRLEEEKEDIAREYEEHFQRALSIAKEEMNKRIQGKVKEMSKKHLKLEEEKRQLEFQLRDLREMNGRHPENPRDAPVDQNVPHRDIPSHRDTPSYSSDSDSDPPSVFIYCPQEHPVETYPDVIKNDPTLLCPYCQTSFCANCRKEAHEDHRCSTSAPKTTRPRDPSPKAKRRDNQIQVKTKLGGKSETFSLPKGSTFKDLYNAFRQKNGKTVSSIRAKVKENDKIEDDSKVITLKEKK